MSPEMSETQIFDSLLPKYIKIENPTHGEPEHMRLRSFPLVIRLHKFKKENKQLEFVYSELLLYRHFRSEDELHRNDPKRCAELYMECLEGESISRVEKIKSIVMKYQEGVEEGRMKADELLESANS